MHLCKPRKDGCMIKYDVQNAIIKLAYNIDCGVKPIVLGTGTEIDLNLFK